MKFIEKLFLKNIRLTGLIVLYFFISLALLIFLIHGLIVLGFNYPLDYGEGPLLNQALRVSQGKPLYPMDFTSPPYLISNYPPVFVLINAFIFWIFGPSLLIGRLLSFLSTLGTALFIALIIRNLNSNQRILPGLAGIATFLIIPYVLEWSPLFRIDMLGLFFSMVGLYLVITRPEKNSTIAFAALFFILAAYTRQSYGLAAPLAAIIWTFTKNKLQALKLFLIYALGGLVIFGILQWQTNGGFFFHIITANVNPFNWQTVWNYAQDIFKKMPWILLMLFLYLGFGWRYTRTYAFLCPYLLGGLAAALTIGKVGSNVNYLIEVSAGFALLVGVFFSYLPEAFEINPEQAPDMDILQEEIPAPENISSQVRKKLWINLVFFIILTGGFIIQITGLSRNSLFGPITSRRDRIKRGNDYIFLEENIKNAAKEGPVLADEFMAVLPDNGIALYLQPFEMTQLANAGLWDQTVLLNSIQDQDFPLILIHHFQFYPVYLERWTPQMRKTIFDNYVAVEMKANSIFFEPKDFINNQYPKKLNCPLSPWLIPTQANMGLLWQNGQLIMMGDGRSGEIPVYAIADGLLYQFPDWHSAVAIQHDDPLNIGKVIWSFYGDLTPAFAAEESYIQDKFHQAEGMPIQAGDLLGYQGTWLGPYEQTWTHLRFTLLPAEEDGSFPEPFMKIDDFHADLPGIKEQIRLGLDEPVSLSIYTGLPESNIFGSLDFLPFACADERE